MDDLVLPVMDDLLACLCAEVAASPAGEVCFCALIPGGQVVADYSCSKSAHGCGQAWVRLVRIFPSRAFPIPDNTAACTGPLAATLELGVYRCLPTVHAQGQSPTATEQTQAVINQTGDWRAMMEAVRCSPALDRLRPDGVMIGNYEAASQGGYGGGKLLVTLKLTNRPR